MDALVTDQVETRRPPHHQLPECTMGEGSYSFMNPNTTVVVHLLDGAGRARPICVPRYQSCAIRAVGHTPLAREETVLVIAAPHNPSASDGRSPPAPAAACTHTDALPAVLAATMVPGDSKPRPFHSAEPRLQAARPLWAARPLRAAAAAVPHAYAADSDDGAHGLDASAATTTSPVSPPRSARPAPPTARTGAVFPRNLIGLA